MRILRFCLLGFCVFLTFDVRMRTAQSAPKRMVGGQGRETEKTERQGVEAYGVGFESAEGGNLLRLFPTGRSSGGRSLIRCGHRGNHDGTPFCLGVGDAESIARG